MPLGTVDMWLLSSFYLKCHTYVVVGVVGQDRLSTFINIMITILFCNFFETKNNSISQKEHYAKSKDEVGVVVVHGMKRLFMGLLIYAFPTSLLRNGV